MIRRLKQSAPTWFHSLRRITIQWLLPAAILALCSSAGAAGGGRTVDFGYSSDLDLADKYANQLKMTRSFGEINYNSDSPGIKWDMSFYYCRPDGVLSYETDKAGNNQDDDWFHIYIPYKNEFTRLNFGIEAIPNFLYLGSSWRFETERRQDVSAIAEISPIDIIKIKGEWGRKHPLPAFADLFYNYRDEGGFASEGGRISLSMPADFQNLSITLRTLPNLKIEYSDLTSKFTPGSFEPGYSYDMMLDGIYRDGQIRAEYSYKRFNKIIAEYRHARARMSLEAFHMKESFAYFGKVNGDFDMAAIKVLSLKWKAALQAGKAEGEIAGAVNSWPFVDGLLIFLGERRQFIGEASLNWIASSFEYKIHQSRQWSMTGMIDYLSLKPEAEYKSWRPMLWGFGVDDLRTDRLNISKADLLRLKIAPSLNISRWTLNFSVSQWIPIYLKKHPSGDSGENSGSTPSSDQSADSHKSSSHGGFAASFNITVRL